MATSYSNTEIHPVQELEQKYPGAKIVDISEAPQCGKQPIFRFRAEVWGYQFDQEGRINKESVKKAVAEEALDKLRRCVTPIDSSRYANEIETKVKAKYIELEEANEVDIAAMCRVVAAIVLEENNERRSSMNVVALGTGTKFISSRRKMIPGMTVNDCHGEIIAKRAFQGYLYQQLSDCFENKDSIFQYDRLSRKYTIKAGISFHLYVSTAPCGDARVFIQGDSTVRDLHTGRAKRGKSRCKMSGGEGSLLAERHQHDDRMVLMTCSDKMASWNITGVQGALLSLLTKPVFFKSIVVGKKYNYSHMARAMFVRIGAIQENRDFPKHYKASAPLIGGASGFMYDETKPSKYSLNWWKGAITAEVIKASTGYTENGSCSRLCKHEMFRKWLDLFQRLPPPEVMENGKPIYLTGNESYADVKNLASEYQYVKQILHDHYDDCLGPWILAREQNNFTMH